MQLAAGSFVPLTSLPLIVSMIYLLSFWFFIVVVFAPEAKTQKKGWWGDRVSEKMRRGSRGKRERERELELELENFILQRL